MESRLGVEPVECKTRKAISQKFPKVSEAVVVSFAKVIDSNNEIRYARSREYVLEVITNSRPLLRLNTRCKLDNITLKKIYLYLVPRAL